MKIDTLELERFEGADGPVAQEMFRILLLLRKKYADLERAEAIVSKKRGDIKKLYSIEVDGNQITKSIRQKNEWITFKQRNKHYKVKGQWVWSTHDVYRRSEWSDQLNSIFNDYVSYKNLIQCPICSKWEVEKYMRKQSDQFHYCEECTVEHEITFEKSKTIINPPMGGGFLME